MIVAANSGYSIGSRVVVQTHQNETVIGELKRSQSSYIEVLAFKKPCPLLSIKRKEIEYIAPIWGCAYRHLGRIIEDSKP